ncbi:MucR family transcriptional regulator [Escherichia coli]|nr:MucR family transcriptional regulator [Escherichia coli]EJG8081933.1 MucR family transcriptional regulator [Escherichia coli]ELO1960225.1 MucR family transcriptional regulator [Escherichia coli]ELO3079130.1 MucR family transcriptional regulator [Escherichia coli]ELO3209618.1 MucR family transcriptional regulator [Escherichia coli]
MTVKKNIITSKSAAQAYTDNDLLECLECGKKFSFLPNHVRKAHAMTPEEYRTKYNLPASTPLAGRVYREKQREKMARLIDSGIVTHWHLPAAVEKSRAAGRGTRTDFDLSEQAQRAKSTGRANLRSYPAGTKRANGRDIERQREYLRAYRASKRGDNTLMIEYHKKYTE